MNSYILNHKVNMSLELESVIILLDQLHKTLAWIL